MGRDGQGVTVKDEQLWQELLDSARDWLKTGRTADAGVAMLMDSIPINEPLRSRIREGLEVVFQAMQNELSEAW